MQLWRLWLVLAHTFIISLTASSALQPQRWGASRVVWHTSGLESETYRIWAVGWLQLAQDGSSLTGFKRMLTVWTMWGLENNPISCDWVCQIGFTRSASAFTWHIPWLLQNFSNVYILEWNGPKCVLLNSFFWSRSSLNSLACSWDTKRNMLTNSSFHGHCPILKTPPFTP